MPDGPAAARLPPGLDSRWIRVEGGRLKVEGCDAEELAARFGTPLYVTSEGRIRANYRRLLAAFAARYPQVRLLYANKANANLAVRRILTQEGAGGDCFGLGELALSLQAGTPPERLVMNGSNKTEDELAAAVRHGVTVNIDHPEELAELVRLARGLGRRARANLRILPFSWAGGMALPAGLAEIAADTSHDKWGFDRPGTLDAVRQALGATDALELRGLHMHVSRVRPDAEPFRLACRLLAACIAELRAETGWVPALLDLGGGYAHARDPEGGEAAGSHPVAEPEAYAEAMCVPLLDAFGVAGIAPPELWLEPGRHLVSDATVLLGRVGAVKRLATHAVTWVNLDASANHCLRASLQGYHYEILHATRAGDPPCGTAHVTGPTCTLDLIGSDRPLPETRRGDLIAVLDVGGYAEVLSTQFNLVPRPATVLVDGARAEVIRRRETYADLTATQVLPPRLL